MQPGASMVLARGDAAAKRGLDPQMTQVAQIIRNWNHDGPAPAR